MDNTIRFLFTVLAVQNLMTVYCFHLLMPHSTLCGGHLYQRVTINVISQSHLIPVAINYLVEPRINLSECLPGVALEPPASLTPSDAFRGMRESSTSLQPFMEIRSALVSSVESRHDRTKAVDMILVSRLKRQLIAVMRNQSRPHVDCRTPG